LAWDANRPIPWRRLFREAAIFLVVGAVAMLFLVNDPQVSSFVGLVIGMAFYVGFVAVLSKFGYQRQSVREARERRQAAASIAATPSASQATRQRPAPTRRTSTGPSQRPNRSTKKRRR
jgi:Ca2+/Na+ antiporter